MNVNIHWEFTDHEEENIDYSRVLYAYLNPESNEILYVGKADYCSVSERMKGKHKEDVFNYIQKEFGLTEISCIVGELSLPKGRKFSSELLSDIESLLIISIQPYANTQNKNSRISRPGLVVTCSGEWPYEDGVFRDE